MDNTLFLAQFLGLFSIIFSVAIILRRKMIVHLLQDFIKNTSFAFAVGTAEMATGLLLVLSHHTYNTVLETTISILGILFLLEGTFYIFASHKIMKKLIHMLDTVSGYYFVAALYFVLGVYLVYAGFGSGFGV